MNNAQKLDANQTTSEIKDSFQKSGAEIINENPAEKFRSLLSESNDAVQEYIEDNAEACSHLAALINSEASEDQALVRDLLKIDLVVFNMCKYNYEQNVMTALENSSAKDRKDILSAAGAEYPLRGAGHYMQINAWNCEI